MLKSTDSCPSSAQPGREKAAYTEQMRRGSALYLNNIDSFLINPGASMIFLDEGMTGLKLRSRDQNGFLGQDRKWTLKEVTPPPVQQGQYATREEFDAMNTKMDKILDVLSELMK